MSILAEMSPAQRCLSLVQILSALVGASAEDAGGDGGALERIDDVAAQLLGEVEKLLHPPTPDEADPLILAIRRVGIESDAITDANVERQAEDEAAQTARPTFLPLERAVRDVDQLLRPFLQAIQAGSPLPVSEAALSGNEEALLMPRRAAAAMVSRSSQSGAEASARPVGGSLEPAEILTIRVTAGLTQLQLAALLGSTEGRIKQFERGTLKPLRLEAWLLEVLNLAMIPMVNQRDRYAWAQEVARVAERDLAEGMAMIFSDGARWRAHAEESEHADR